MDKNLTLNGSGPDLLTVQRSAAQGTPDFGIFETSEGETVNLSEMTISKGKAPGFGGGINANGPLTVTGCKVSNNTGGQGGGINSFSLLNVIASTISNNNSFDEFLRDKQTVAQGVVVGVGNWQQQLATNKAAAFALAFVQRTDFLARYSAQTGAAAFVNNLNANAGGVLNDAERSALITELSPNPSDVNLRADVLQKVAENAALQQQEFDRAFVLMEYFGYLRRDPDSAPDASYAGYQFWLSKLNQFGGNYIQAEMVKAFISADEYRKRFGQ